MAFQCLTIHRQIFQVTVRMHKTIISDTSCFIILAKTEELDLLHKVYGRIITTPEIATEYGDILPDWVDVIPVADSFRQQLLEIQIGKGESSAIALALEIKDSLLILDDQKARLMARHLGLAYSGTIGVIVKAKRLGIIPSIKPYLEKIRQTDFRLSEAIEEIALKEAGES